MTTYTTWETTTKNEELKKLQWDNGSLNFSTSPKIKGRKYTTQEEVTIKARAKNDERDWFFHFKNQKTLNDMKHYFDCMHYIFIDNGRGNWGYPVFDIDPPKDFEGEFNIEIIQARLCEVFSEYFDVFLFHNGFIAKSGMKESYRIILRGVYFETNYLSQMTNLCKILNEKWGGQEIFDTQIYAFNKSYRMPGYMKCNQSEEKRTEKSIIRLFTKKENAELSCFNDSHNDVGNLIFLYNRWGMSGKILKQLDFVVKKAIICDNEKIENNKEDVEIFEKFLPGTKVVWKNETEYTVYDVKNLSPCPCCGKQHNDRIGTITKRSGSFYFHCYESGFSGVRLSMDNFIFPPLKFDSVKKGKWFSMDIGAKINIFKAPMGSGKTTCLAEFTKTNKDASILVISPRQTLSTTLDSKLYNMNDYRRKGAFESKRLICQLESLHKVELWNIVYDYVVIDELEALVNEFSSHTMGGYRNECYTLFRLAISKAKHVLCFDANVSSRSIEFMKRFSEDVKVNKFLIKNEKRDCIMYRGRNVLKARFLKDDRCKVALFTSKRKMEKMYNALEKAKYNMDRVLRISSDNVYRKNIKLLFEEIEKYENTKEEIFLDYDIIMYTSKLGIGIDIHSSRHKVCYAFFNTSTLSFDECSQMLRRFRNISEYHIEIERGHIEENIPFERNIISSLAEERCGKYLNVSYGGWLCLKPEYKEIMIDNRLWKNYSVKNFHHGFIKNLRDMGFVISDSEDRITTTECVALEIDDIVDLDQTICRYDLKLSEEYEKRLVKCLTTKAKLKGFQEYVRYKRSYGENRKFQACEYFLNILGIDPNRPYVDESHCIELKKMVVRNLYVDVLEMKGMFGKSVTRKLYNVGRGVKFVDLMNLTNRAITNHNSPKIKSEVAFLKKVLKTLYIYTDWKSRKAYVRDFPEIKECDKGPKIIEIYKRISIWWSDNTYYLKV